MQSNFAAPDFIRQPLRLKDIFFEVQPTRPLGTFSDYVREQLPTPNPNLTEALSLLPNEKQLRSLSQEEAHVALLDLKMLFVAASVHKAPDRVVKRFMTEQLRY